MQCASKHNGHRLTHFSLNVCTQRACFSVRIQALTYRNLFIMSARYRAVTDGVTLLEGKMPEWNFVQWNWTAEGM